MIYIRVWYIHDLQGGQKENTHIFLLRAMYNTRPAAHLGQSLGRYLVGVVDDIVQEDHNLVSLHALQVVLGGLHAPLGPNVGQLARALDHARVNVRVLRSRK